MTGKTIISPQMPLRNNGKPSIVGADRPCMGVDLSAIFPERATCQRYSQFLGGDTFLLMRLPRVGAHACHYRIEATK